MTDLIAPASPSTPPSTPASSNAPDRSAAVAIDRSRTFGPALADARDQLRDRPEPDRSTTSTSTETAESRSGAESEAVDGDDRTSSGERVDEGESDTTPPIDEASTEAASDDITDTSDTVGIESPAEGSGAIAASSTRNEQLALTLPTGERNDHPTAKGAVGDGDLSTTPTVDEVAAPRPLSSALPAGVTEADGPVVAGGIDGSPAARTVTGSVDAADVAMPAQTVEMTPAPVATAAGGVPTTTEAPAGVVPAAAATPDSADMPGAQIQTNSLASGLVSTMPPEESDPSSPMPNHAMPKLVVSENTGETAPIPAADAAAVVAPDVADHPAATSDGDSVVVLAREAARPESLARPTAAPSTTGAPPAGPLDVAAGSLWEDVRVAFDRIRTSGEGQEVRIRLRPAELGELLVQIRTQGDHVAVKLTTSSAAAQQTLVEDRLRLAAELARAGFDEGSVDIGQQGRDHDRSDERHEGQLGRPHQQAHHDRGRGRTIAEPDIGVGERPDFERRAPIRTESGFRPGRHVHSTINLTL